MCLVSVLTSQQLQIPPHFNMYLAVNKCITSLGLQSFPTYQYPGSTSDVNVFGYIDVSYT